jgi:hypothetical protein
MTALTLAQLDALEKQITVLHLLLTELRRGLLRAPREEASCESTEFCGRVNPEGRQSCGGFGSRWICKGCQNTFEE